MHAEVAKESIFAKKYTKVNGMAPDHPLCDHLYSPEVSRRKEILTLKILITNYYQVTELNTEKTHNSEK